MKAAWVLIPLFSLSVQAGAADLLRFAGEQFDASRSPRVGIEVEMSGLSTKEIANTTYAKVGGEMTIVPNEYGFPEYHIQNSKIGKVIIKPEDNGSSSQTNLKEEYQKTRITEIVTSPLHYPQVELLQLVMNDLKASGAKGTADGFAVSIQTNEEIADGKPREKSTSVILNLLRNFLDAENRANIAESLKVADFRKVYIGNYSPGFMQKLADMTYNPTWRQLYDDFMYRQSAERLNMADAWSAPISKVREDVMKTVNKEGFEKILPVVKWNDIRISSLMIDLFPKDAFSKFLVDTTWFRGYPAIENRVRDNDFNVLKAVRENLGISQLSRDFGIFHSERPEDYRRFINFKTNKCTNLFAN